MFDDRATAPRSRSLSGSESCLKASLIDSGPDCRRSGILIRVSGVAVPESMSAAAVRTFSTLPGSYGEEIALLPRASVEEALGFEESKVGALAMARTSPVLTFMTTTEP